MKFKTSAEGLYLLLMVALILFVGPGMLFNKALAHSTPQGFKASDSYWHYSLSQYVKEQGSYNLMPPSMVAGYKDVVGFNPPIIYTTTASLSMLSGLEVYDVIQIIGLLFTLLGILAMYFIVRRASKSLATLALPLTMLAYFLPFSVAFLMGQWHFLTGIAFLTGAVMVIAILGISRGWPLLAVMLMGLINSHTAEFYYLVGFLVIYFAAKLIAGQLKLQEIWKTALAYAIAIAASFYYALIFLNTYQKYTTVKLFKVTTSVTNFPNVHFSDFHWLQFFLLVGVLLSLYFIARKILSRQAIEPALLFSWAMLGVGLANYVFLDYHAFQARFLWPIYLAPLIAYPVYQLLSLVKMNNSLIAIGAGIILAMVVVFSIADLAPKQMQESSLYWDQVKWIKQNIPVDAKVLYLPGEWNYGAVVWPQERVPYIASIDKQAAANGQITRNYSIYISSASDSRFAYRKGLFSYGYHGNDENITISNDICSYDYWVIDAISQDQAIVNYNNALAGKLNAVGAEQLYANGKGYILKNSGGDCLGET
jgi:hypothetical protein